MRSTRSFRVYRLKAYSARGTLPLAVLFIIRILRM